MADFTNAPKCITWKGLKCLKKVDDDDILSSTNQKEGDHHFYIWYSPDNDGDYILVKFITTAEGKKQIIGFNDTPYELSGDDVFYEIPYEGLDTPESIRTGTEYTLGTNNKLILKNNNGGKRKNKSKKTKKSKKTRKNKKRKTKSKK